MSQTVTVQYDVTVFDGETQSLPFEPETTGQTSDDQITRISAEAIGLIDPTFDALEGDGGLGNRFIPWLLVDGRGVVGSAGAALEVVALNDDGSVIVQETIADLAGVGRLYTRAGILVPQGSRLRISGFTADANQLLLRFNVLELETPRDTVAVLQLLQSESDGGGGGGGLIFSEDIASSAGSVQLEVGVIERFDASALADDELILVLPEDPVKDQETGIKDVGDSFVEVLLDGNGNDVETLTDAPAATNSTGIARQSLTLKFDGAGTWRAI